jgi:hypothetical protein
VANALAALVAAAPVVPAVVATTAPVEAADFSPGLSAIAPTDLDFCTERATTTSTLAISNIVSAAIRYVVRFIDTSCAMHGGA